ncbi:CopG family transcriptional regulator [Mariprofundus sp. EBB-1]|uniref:CopG family transcriptional regulator n=1 Tax=Mariprofundus sp. EBB-1 TaxID=2650971 RepID=UPI000EF24427|nr:CopG family transcriptional regulator [Mariprofundus sp. EBB-1]RLL55954.1 CopG family transcriptional regulator [Mariprofundus sp. EBB-1]
MGQVTVYLDDKTEDEMNSAVKASGLSKSKWVARVIHEKAGSEWPETVAQLAGAWPDFPSQDEIRRTSGEDAPREPF